MLDSTIKKQKLIDINTSRTYTAIDGEEITVYFKSFNPISADFHTIEMGAYVGAIEMVYPFAGMGLTLTLDVFQAYIEDFESSSGAFKLPFVESIENIEILLYEKWLDGLGNLEAEHPHDLKKCGCGGNMIPMYDEHPCWITFCSKCGSRDENTDKSPFPY